MEVPPCACMAVFEQTEGRSENRQSTSVFEIPSRQRYPLTHFFAYVPIDRRRKGLCWRVVAAPPDTRQLY